MEYEQLKELLVKGMGHPLPGKQAQVKMSPLPIDHRRFEDALPDHYRKGAVLILFYPFHKQARFPLIKRPEYPGVHSGQIALPGGKMENYDSDIIETALREANEEVGVDPAQVEIFGQMSDLFIPASNFLVSPVIGFTEDVPDFVPEEREVERIIQASVKNLLEPSFRKRKILTLSDNFKLDTPYFEVEKEVLWGATAMILSEFLGILENGKK